MIILASKSPRRRELLSLITNEFEIKTADVDEALPNGISPKEAVQYLSKIKAEPFKNETDTVIGADTVVAVDGKILGKPASKQDAFDMLRMLSGRVHSVFTGVTILRGEEETTFFCETKVEFLELSDEQIWDYIATGDPMDKAGEYGIQNGGALFVKKIDGDYSNVVGLPVSLLNIYLKR